MLMRQPKKNLAHDVLSCRSVWQKEEAPLLPSFSQDEQEYQKNAWEGLIGGFCVLIF